MKGRIKAIDGIYPVTVDEAIYISGTNKTIKDKIEFSEYITKIKDKTSNLFDKDNIEINGYYDLNNGGSWVDDVNMVSSSFIPITPSTQYIRNSTSSIINNFYTSDKLFINGNRNASFTSPSNAYYIRIAVKKDNIDSEMLVEGSVIPSEYEEYCPTPVYDMSSNSFNIHIKKNYITKDKLNEELYSEIKISDTERFEKALPKVPLQIETYKNGANEPYHPSIVKFDTAWNGYKYWMAYTPFPDEANENPCICASNDLIKWETPAGLINPLDKPHDYDTGATGYWSDTNLLYNPDKDRLECFYRGIGASATGENNICRKTSSDGITWSDRETIFTFTQGSYVSQSVIYENGKYTMYFCRPGYIYESTDGINWTKTGTLSFFPTNYSFWHQDIIKTDIGYELVGMESVGLNTRIIHFTSTDGIIFRDGKEIVKVLDNNKYGIKGFYKPALVKENGIYYLFLSINWTNGTNGMSLAISDKLNDITSIKGIDQNYIPYMSKYTRKGLSGFEGQIVFDTELNKMVYCKKGGRKAIWVDFNGNNV